MGLLMLKVLTGLTAVYWTLLSLGVSGVSL